MNGEDLAVTFAARAMERLMVVGGGILAIWLGYRLFSMVVADRGAFEAQSGKWSVRLQRIGPGVFFALFGSGTLAFAISNPLTVTNPNGDILVASARYAGDAAAVVTEDSRAEDLVRAITLTTSYVTRSPILAELGPEDRGILNDQLSRLSSYRQELIDSIYGAGTAEWYFETYQAERRDPATLERLSAEERQRYERIRGVMQGPESPS